MGNAVDEMSRLCQTGCRSNLHTLLVMIETELKKKNMWKYVLSLNVIKESINPSVDVSNPLTYIHKLVTFKEKVPTQEGGYVLVPFTVHVIISLKSLEVAALYKDDMDTESK